MSAREHAQSNDANVDRSLAVRTFVRRARAGISLPFPGLGNTAERFRTLRAEAAADASVGRLFEAHADALAISFEAGISPPLQSALAVWASGSTASTRVEEGVDGTRLNGKRSFCGGATIVDAALMTTDSPEGERLVFVRLNQPGISVDTGTWRTEAFREAGVSTVYFDNVRIDVDSFIGPPGWYGQREGFWFGAVGVAAVWAGMADTLIDALPVVRRKRDDVSRIATGAIEASMWAVSALLEQAAMQLDEIATIPDRSDRIRVAKSIALCTRHTVRSHLEVAMSAFDQEVGPALMAFEKDLARSRMELSMSLGQAHGPRDLLVLTDDT